LTKLQAVKGGNFLRHSVVYFALIFCLWFSADD